MLHRRHAANALSIPSIAAAAVAAAFVAAPWPAAAQSARLETAGGQTTFVPSEEIVLRYSGISTSPMDYLELGADGGERLQSRVLGREGESVDGAWRLDLPEGRYVVRWLSPGDPNRAWEAVLRAEARFEVTAEGAAVAQTTDAQATDAAAAEEPGAEAPAEAAAAAEAGTAAAPAEGDETAPVVEELPPEEAEVAVAEEAPVLEPEADAAAEAPAVEPDVVEEATPQPVEPLPDETAAAEPAPEAGAGAEEDRFAQAGDGWTTYRNARFGTAITFPDETFRPLEAPETRDGRQFATTTDDARLEIYAWKNEDGETPQTLRRRLMTAQGYGNVTYKPVGRNWLVLSGFRDGNVFYEKYLFKPQDGTVHAFAMEFPRNRRGVYDSLLERIEDSFSAGESAAR